MAAPNPNKPQVGDILLVIRESFRAPRHDFASPIASDCTFLGPAIEPGLLHRQHARRLPRRQETIADTDPPASQTTSRPAVPTS